MRFSLKHHNRRANQGFTLVEMLVVAPIVIIVITGLVAAMVAMVGDALAANGRAATAYDTQDALDRIEQDVRTTVNFMGTFNYLTSPQGRDGNTSAFSFSANKDLILTQQATTSSPYDSNRNLVYYANQPAGCLEDLSINNTLNVRTIYFLKDGSLWRRTLVDAWNKNSAVDSDTVCSDPWQRDSCPNIAGVTLGAAPAATCNTYDEELLKNVTAFTPTFYTNGTNTTPNPLIASSVKVEITTSKVVGGETITQTSTIRAARRNDVPTDTTTPGNPVITQFNPDIDSYNNALHISFQWTANKANRYMYQTSTDNVNWTTPKLTTNTWTTVDVAYQNQPAWIRVTAYNDIGSSSTVTQTYNSTTWAACPLQNGWDAYAGGYETASYTKTSSNVVMMHGLIKGGTTTSGTLLCTLPPEFRPNKRLIFQVQTYVAATGRIDIDTNGNVIFLYGSSTWINLDQIAFLPTSSSYTWSSDLPSYNSWVNYGSVYSNVVVSQDSTGRNHMEGLARSGTTTNGANMFLMPTGYAPGTVDIYPTACSVGSAVQVSTAGYIQARGIPCNGYLSTQIMWWPSSATGWSNIGLGASWVNYGSTYSTAQYKKGADDIVSLRGLIKSGTATSGTVIATLPTGYRPAKNVICTTITYDSAQASAAGARIDVASDGRIYIREGVLTNWVSLAGCNFLAEQ